MTEFRSRFLLLLSWCLIASGVGAAELPAGVVPEGLGVYIHFTDPAPGEMEAIAAAGFRFVRMDFAWGATERRKGEYDFAAYDRLMTALDAPKMRALFILDYSSPLYDEGLPPHTDEGRAAFARWAAAAVKHFRGRGVPWEVWNEPNIKQFWKPQPSAEDYAKLAMTVGKAVREAAPGESVIGPATSRIDLGFLEICFKGGALEYFTAVSVHPYRQEDPETAAAEYAKLRELVARYAPAGRTIPILSGEWGYSSAWRRFDEQKQGKMLPRQWLVNLSEGIPLSIWYDWKDDGPEEKEPEHHFGTVRYHTPRGGGKPFDPKPAFLAARTLTTVLKGFQFDRRLEAGSPENYVLLFKKGDEVRVAAWTRAKDPQRVTVKGILAGNYVAVGHTGDRLAMIAARVEGCEITLSDAPQYLSK